MPISVCTFEKLETFKNFRRTTVTSRCGCYTTAWKGPFKRDSRTLDCQIVSGHSWECRILRGVMLNVKFNAQRNKRWHKTRTYTPQRNNVINLFQREDKVWVLREVLSLHDQHLDELSQPHASMYSHTGVFRLQSKHQWWISQNNVTHTRQSSRIDFSCIFRRDVVGVKPICRWWVIIIYI